MTDSIVWWLTLEAIGLASFPIAFSFFRFLPDRGFGASKVLGLLFMSYVLWIAATVGGLPSARWSLLLILALLALASGALAVRRRRSLRRFLRRQWPVILLTEGAFLSIFAGFLFYYSHIPSYGYAEQPTDMAFLSALVRDQHFPPEDPWLAGESMRYYFFGHLTVSVMAKLTGISASVAFHLGSAMIGALVGSVAFGLLYNLVRRGAGQWRAVAFGGVGLVLVLFLSNLEPPFELMATHGVGSAEFYDKLGIPGLEAARSSVHWYPDPDFWWGRVANVSTPFDARDFPFNKVVFGGIRPDFTVIPFQLLVLTVVLNLVLSPGRLEPKTVSRRLGLLLLTALSLGAVAFTDTWSLPAFSLLVVAAIVARSQLAGPSRRIRSAAAGLAVAAAVLVTGILLFLPAYFMHLPTGGQSGVEVLEAARPVWCGKECTVTGAGDVLIYDLPALWLGVSLGLAVLVVRRGADGWRKSGWGLLAIAVPLSMWASWILLRGGPGQLLDELEARGGNWLTLFLLALPLAAVGTAFAALMLNGARDRRLLPLAFALVVAGVGLLVLFGLELFWVEDYAKIRNNTTLKLNSQAWALLGVAGAYGLHQALAWRPGGLPARAVRWAWAAATGLVIAAALIYPVIVLPSRTNGFTGARSLDALAGMRATNPSEYGAIQWLLHDVAGRPTIVEAVGSSWSGFARISTNTGLPAVLGWPDHEVHWRGSAAAIEERKLAVQRIYQGDEAETRGLLEAYDVEYVYVGRLEREAYGVDGLNKFAQFMDVVYQNEDVTIYRVRD